MLRQPRHPELLELESEPAFEKYTEATARLLHAPSAMISLAPGLGDSEAAPHTASPAWALCRQVVTTDRPLAVEDAPGYAGAPIHADGQPVGALCALSSDRRRWTREDLAVLESLAMAVDTEIALQRAKRELANCTSLLSALRETEAQLRLTVDRSPIGMALVSPEGRWLRVNGALCALVGYSREQLLQRDLRAITHADDLAADFAMWQQLLSGETEAYQLEKRCLHQSGSIVWALQTVSLVRDERGKPSFFITQLQDISERRRLEQQVRETSLQDDLTGLQNRRGFMLLGEQALTSAARYRRGMVLLFADLNGLKKVNDELGHHAGDQLLVAMAETMRVTFRRADILARLGGDEFVLLAEGDETFAALAELKLQKAIESYNARTRGSHALSASIGSVAFSSGDNMTLRELLATADARMYAAKRQYKASNPVASAAHER